MSDLVRNPGCLFSRVKDTELRGCDGRGGGGGDKIPQAGIYVNKVDTLTPNDIGKYLGNSSILT